MRIEDELYLYICGIDKKSCKNIKVTEKVYDFMRIMQMKNSEKIVSMGNATVHEEIRKVIGTLHKGRACILSSSVNYDIDINRWFMQKHLGRKKEENVDFSPDVLLKWTKKCKRDIFAFPVTIYNKEGGHANMVIVNKLNKTIEHFEPHGGSFTFMTDKENRKIRREIRNLFIDCCFNGYKYVSPKNICPLNFGVQTIQSLKSKNKNLFGSCAWWSMWYINVRLAHPELSPKKAYKRALDIAAKNNNEGKNIENFILNFIKELLSLTKFYKIELDEVFYRIKDENGKIVYDNRLEETDKISSCCYKKKIYNFGGRLVNLGYYKVNN